LTPETAPIVGESFQLSERHNPEKGKGVHLRYIFGGILFTSNDAFELLASALKNTFLPIDAVTQTYPAFLSMPSGKTAYDQFLVQNHPTEVAGRAEDDKTRPDAADERLVKQRPTVWLLHYKDEDRPAALLMGDDPGKGIHWRSTKTIKEIKKGDPVLYWHDINKKTKNRGGLVGTGRFEEGLSYSRDEFDPTKNKDVRWHYYPTSVVELFTDNPLARDPLIEKTGLKLNWGFGSILKVPPEMAERIDAYLVAHDRKTLFDKKPTRVDKPEIDFIGDAPIKDKDYLHRAEIAFVLAARLNKVWEEISAERKDTDRKGDTPARANSNGSFKKPKKKAAEAGFVVHIDAPWGGGKTTFANYLTRILDPYRTPGPVPDWLARLPLHDSRFWPERFRRPWLVVNFNAWQHQHVDPPWWCFYQAIQRQCFHAVRTETFAAKPTPPLGKTARPGGKDRDQIPPDPYPPDGCHFQGAWVRMSNWFSVWREELQWRVFNPKVRALALTFLLTWIAAVFLYWLGLFKPEAIKEALAGNIKNLPAALSTGLVILLGGATAIWSIFATVTESLLPGTPDAAKNYSLGSGDPLERLKLRFDQMIRRLGWPVLVIIDDIDRCEPNFVVSILRGIHTIFNSPRANFVLLGDRDWIELAFAHVHKPMQGIGVGPEHTFGGRFVEKAIQLSLVLPDVSPEGRIDYVGTLLGVDPRLKEKSIEAIPEKVRQDIEEEVETIMSNKDPLARDDSADSLRKSIRENATLEDAAQQAVVKEIDRKLALRSAADEKVQEATKHRLVPIASVLPANPRQIKRIINGIALFQEIARIEQEVQPGSDDWRKLALWVTIMTEWPRTWDLLSTYPGLIDLVHGPSKKISDADLPEENSRKDWVKKIKENRSIMNLIDFNAVDDWPATRIDSSAIKRFRVFMPAPGAIPAMGGPETEEKPEDG
jgi:hypothetical protein